MNGTNNFACKNIYLAHFKIVQNFHYFCKVRACWISVKNSNFQKLPKVVEKHFFWWMEQIILPKNIFLAHLKIVQNFHFFYNVSACRISVKNSYFQNLPKVVEKHFFWWMEQIICHKIIFLAHFKIVQNFHFFIRSAPVEFPSKIHISKTCLKLWRNTSFNEWNK